MKNKRLASIITIVFSILILIGIAVCAICDAAISGGFTWSLIPISSMIFTWLTFFPLSKLGVRGICGTLAVFSILIIPYLYVLDSVIKINGSLLPIGIPIAVLSVLYLWAIFILFKVFKAKKLIAAGITLLLAIPVRFLISLTVSIMTSDALLNGWDILSFSVLLLLAVVCFLIASMKNAAKSYAGMPEGGE